MIKEEKSLIEDQEIVIFGLDCRDIDIQFETNELETKWANLVNFDFRFIVYQTVFGTLHSNLYLIIEKENSQRSQRTASYL